MEIKHFSRNNQQKPSNKTNKQNHLLADLKLKYGDRMIELGEQDINNDNKILNLIRSIAYNNFDYNEFGSLLTIPYIFDRIYQVAKNEQIQAMIHSQATQILRWNQDAINNMCIPAEYVHAVADKDRDILDAWNTIIAGLDSVYMSNGNLVGLQGAINHLSSLRCSDGRTSLTRLI